MRARVPGQVFVLSGPSGVGKGSIIGGILARLDDIELSISATTRRPRAGESDSHSYDFVARNEFEQMIADDDLLEWADVYGAFYGTPRGPVAAAVGAGRDVILEIDVQGAESVRRSMPEAITLFIEPPGIDDLERRLRGRATDNDEVIERRLAKASAELAEAPKFHYRVVNDRLENAIDQAVDIIDTCRKDRQT